VLHLLSKEKFDVDSRSEPKGEALTVRGSGDHKSNLYCRYYRKNTHHISQCPKVRNKEEKKKKELDKSSVEASFVETLDSGEVLFVACVEKCSSWILDSACTFHICSHRDWFYDYVQSHAGEVVIGDVSTCQIIGIGSIYIQVHDGNIKKLINVRFVPKLKRNLIYLSTLEAMGFNFAVINGVLKVSRGNRIILKGNRLNNLYYLQCSTVDAEAVSIAFQKSGYFDDTKPCSSSKSNDSLDLVDIQI
jgi:hypothetical protein